MAGSSTILELSDLCKRVKLAILFLMETKANSVRMEEIKRKLNFDHLFCVEARGLSRGLSLMWRKSMQVEIVEYYQNFIHVSCYGKEDWFGGWKLCLWQSNFQREEISLAEIGEPSL